MKSNVEILKDLKADLRNGKYNSSYERSCLLKSINRYKHLVKLDEMQTKVVTSKGINFSDIYP